MDLQQIPELDAIGWRLRHRAERAYQRRIGTEAYLSSTVKGASVPHTALAAEVDVTEATLLG